MGINQLLALFLMFLLAAALLGRWILVPAGIIGLILLIRVLADFYWFIKGDEEK